MNGGRTGWDTDVTLRVDAPRERVWAIVSDIGGHPALAGSGEVIAIRMAGPLAVGTTFEGDVATSEVGSFTARCVIEEVDEPERLAWVSRPPLDEGETEDHQIEVYWSFDITPASTGGVDVRHAFRIPAPKAGADELGAFIERTDRLATVTMGMRRTLQNVKDLAERPS